MKYTHIIRAVVETPWAILESKLHEIEALLEFQASGKKFSADDIQARLGGATRTETSSRAGAVAVIPLQGVISHRLGGMSEISGGTSTERVSALLKQALAEPTVGHILLDVNSPGGTISGVTELAAEIRAAAQQKPVTAQVNALAASAAYWAISGASEIVVTPSGEVGSIGVITAHVDTTKAEEQEGITRTVISAGKYKAELHGALSDEAKSAIQARVDEAYATMVADIAKGRGVPVADVRNGFGEGRLVGAKAAVQAGMADRVGTMDETLSRLVGRRTPAGPRAEVVGDDASLAAVAAGGSADAAAGEADRKRRWRMA